MDETEPTSTRSGLRFGRTSCSTSKLLCVFLTAAIGLGCSAFALSSYGSGGVSDLIESVFVPDAAAIPVSNRNGDGSKHALTLLALTYRFSTSPTPRQRTSSARRCAERRLHRLRRSRSRPRRSSTAGPATNAVEIGGPPSTKKAGVSAKMGAAWRACTSTATVAASRSTALRRQNAAASQTSTPAMRSTSGGRLTLEAGLAALPTSTCAIFVDA